MEYNSEWLATQVHDLVYLHLVLYLQPMSVVV